MKATTEVAGLRKHFGPTTAMDAPPSRWRPG
jgi:hypothetical protein